MALFGKGSAVQTLEQENERLRRAVEELSLLNDLAREIGASPDADAVMQRIVRRSLLAVQAEQGVITLVDEEDGAGNAGLRTLVRTRSSSSDHPAFRPDQTLLGWMMLYGKPVRIDDAQSDQRFLNNSWDASIRSILCVPLTVRSKLIGILTVYNKKGEDPAFNEEDQRLLAIIAAQSAQVVDNARLLKEQQALVRLQEQFRLARQIQTSLLPDEPPLIQGYELAGTSVPAQSVGGDYFDYLKIDSSRMGLCVGDVSGKGVPAALLMSNVQATLRGQAPEVAAEPAICVARANDLLCRSTRKGSFVTFFYGVLDHRSHHFRYANAGHNRPFRIDRSGTITELSQGGLVLGFVSDQIYEEATIALSVGDVLFIYSDGLCEAINERREQFGEVPLAEVVRHHRDEPTSGIVEHVLSAVRAHVGKAPQADDMTMLVVKRMA